MHAIFRNYLFFDEADSSHFIEIVQIGLLRRFSQSRHQVVVSITSYFHSYFHSFVSVDHPPYQSPEPMRGGAVSSASRLDVSWSRMAQLFSLSIAATVIEYGDLFAQIVIYAPEFMQLAF
jgi:hypothetical protein